MKKIYLKPVIEKCKFENQSLMALSVNDPKTSVNHEEYDGKFSANENSSFWDDED